MKYRGDTYDEAFDEGCDSQYIRLIATCMQHGKEISTRNSKVKRLITSQMSFHKTPLVTIRKAAWKTCIRELEWMLSGSSDINDLHPSVKSWWEPFANSSGNVLFNYSKQFRRFHGNTGVIDQVATLVEGIRKHPNSRRNLITTWNTQEMNDPACPITNCWGTVIQAFVEEGRLHLVTYQRSVDVVCGLPHNLLQMSAFQLWLCSQTGLLVDGLTWIGGDVHVYEQHYDLAERMLAVELPEGDVPTLCYQPTSDAFKADDFYLDGEYKPVLTDKAEMVV